MAGAFKKLVGKLAGKGKSAAQAKGIAAKVGMEKYGKAGMEKKAAAGRARPRRRDGNRAQAAPPAPAHPVRSCGPSPQPHRSF